MPTQAGYGYKDSLSKYVDFHYKDDIFIFLDGPQDYLMYMPFLPIALLKPICGYFNFNVIYCKMFNW